MNRDTQGGLQAIQKAKLAYQGGNPKEARHWAEVAVSLAPDLEEGWLWLASVSSPRTGLNYLNRALKINPNSARAQRGIAWAAQRVKESPDLGPTRPTRRIIVDRSISSQEMVRAKPAPGWMVFAWVVAALVVIAGLWAWYGGSGSLFSKAAGQALGQIGALPGGNPVVVAQANLDKATRTPTLTATNTPTSTFTPTSTSTNTSTATATSTKRPTKTPAPTKKPTKVPPTSAPAKQNVDQPPVASSENWVDVDLTHQRAYAYRGHKLIRSFLVSTGTWQHPTVTGQFHIYVKYVSALMTGPGYYLPNVPYVMYFYKGYGLHGTYWHHNFGTPMSHGCVNFSTPDAAWLFDFAEVGTLVNVHY